MQWLNWWVEIFDRVWPKKGDHGTRQQNFIDYLCIVPWPARFGLGRWKHGRIGKAGYYKVAEVPNWSQWKFVAEYPGHSVSKIYWGEKIYKIC